MLLFKFPTYASRVIFTLSTALIVVGTFVWMVRKTTTKYSSFITCPTQVVVALSSQSSKGYAPVAAGNDVLPPPQQSAGHNHVFLLSLVAEQFPAFCRERVVSQSGAPGHSYVTAFRVNCSVLQLSQTCKVKFNLFYICEIIKGAKLINKTPLKFKFLLIVLNNLLIFSL